MLVLTRKMGQKILIGKGLIQVKVLKISAGVISIGIQAPQHIEVDREEIYLKKLYEEKTEGSKLKVRL